jgi:predicted metal-dependent phosphoesterase TrpH
MAANLAQDGSMSAQDAAALRSVFETITAESCPHSFNFHMHTVCSDGKLQPEQLIEQATAIGLRGLAITDHHSVQGYRKAQRWLARQRLDQQQLDQQSDQTVPKLPQLWTGVEVTASLLNDEVHILGYAFDPTHSAMQLYLQGRSTTGEAFQAASAIAAIQAAGGLAVLAHPARYRRSPDQLIPAAAQLGINGVETFYAYNNPSPWSPSLKQTTAIKAIGATHNLFNTCGTDTHGLSLLQRL